MLFIYGVFRIRRRKEPIGLVFKIALMAFNWVHGRTTRFGQRSFCSSEPISLGTENSDISRNVLNSAQRRGYLTMPTCSRRF